MKCYILLLFLIYFASLSAIIINIPEDYTTIQEGINVAISGDTVLVQPGIYFENIFYFIKNITVTSLYLTTQDTSYISQTIIDGNQNDSVLMLQGSYQDSSTVICGFTIQNGYNHFHCGGTGRGGGIYILNDYFLPAKPILDNLIIKDNYAVSGGGITIDSSYPDIQGPILRDILIQDNSAEFDGGISISGSKVSMERVTISNNFAAQSVGGCTFGDSSVIMEDVIVSNNVAENYVGGIAIAYSDVYMMNVKIQNNTIDGIRSMGYESNIFMEDVIISGNSGKGIYCFEDQLEIKNSIIANNLSTGIMLYDSNTIMENVLVKNNEDRGIMIVNTGGYFDSNTQIMNSTITSNIGGGILCDNFDSATNQTLLVNSIIWDNEPYQIHLDEYCSMSIHNSNVQDGENGISTSYYVYCLWGESNIQSDPLFISPEENDFHLQNISPCIGAGTTQIEIEEDLYFPEGTYYSPNVDIEGNPRPSPEDSMPDIGAYENVLGEPQVGTSDDLTLTITSLYNYPNPFNPETTIFFNLSEVENVELEIFNIKGQKVKQLVSDQLSAGQHNIAWNGKDDDKQVSSGIYFYKLKAGDFQQTKKMILLK